MSSSASQGACPAENITPTPPGNADGADGSIIGSSNGNGVEIVEEDPLTPFDQGKWYFTPERLADTPSRRMGVCEAKEESYRVLAASFLQDLGETFKLSQTCINTAVVYMHRFFMIHSFTQFPRYDVSAAALYVAGRVNDELIPAGKIVERTHQVLFEPTLPPMRFDSQQFKDKIEDLYLNENILLQTLGFVLTCELPNWEVILCCHRKHSDPKTTELVYDLASISLQLTTMCLQHKPVVAAHLCYRLAAKLTNLEEKFCNIIEEYFKDDSVAPELLEQLTSEFLDKFNKASPRLSLKRRIVNSPFAASHASSFSPLLKPSVPVIGKILISSNSEFRVPSSLNVPRRLKQAHDSGKSNAPNSSISVGPGHSKAIIAGPSRALVP